MIKRLTFLASMAVLWGFGIIGNAFAAGRSEPWQMGHQEAASPLMEQIIEFHNLLLIIEGLIVLFVMGLLGYIILRFNAKANPVPSKTTHNTVLEVIWTAVPILILVAIAIPSMKLLYYSDKAQDAEMTLKVTGHQWYWSYSYPDQGAFEFDSTMIPDEDLKKDQPRLLSTDNPVVLPINTTIRILLASDDVIHNWAVPSLGLKTDATPGRTNEAWVRINSEGSYYGMCSELCGINHAYMPIHIEAVSKEAFAAWAKKAKQEFASEKAKSHRLVQTASVSR